MEDHSLVLKGIYAQLRHILESSGQGIYIYLDDENIICNKKFASMLGYGTPEAWAKAGSPFPSTYVEKKSQPVLVDAYRKAVGKGEASKVNIAWKKKNSGSLKTSVILVPVAFLGHIMALHFIDKI